MQNARKRGMSLELLRLLSLARASGFQMLCNSVLKRLSILTSHWFTEDRRGLHVGHAILHANGIEPTQEYP
jgi:hypothetical protein